MRDGREAYIIEHVHTGIRTADAFCLADIERMLDDYKADGSSPIAQLLQAECPHCEAERRLQNSK